MYYSNGIWRRCTNSPAFALNNLQSPPLHLAQAWPANLRVAEWRVVCDCVTHFLFGLCNIDVWLQQVGRHFDGDFTSLFIKVSALCQLVKCALICLPRCMKRNKADMERMRGRRGVQALWVWNIKSDASLSSDWQEIIDKCVYWLFSVIAGEKQ